jgi:Cu+-exporting ATPase
VRAAGINNYLKGFYSFRNKYREGLQAVVSDLKGEYSLSLVSGDNDSEKSNLKKFFEDDNMFFNQSYADKLNYIKMLQRKGKKVLMIGDGLNDAAALKQSDVGISISEDSTNFSPACDAILDASEFSKIGKFIKFTKSITKLTKLSASISLFYILIGLCFASQGILPVMVSAILIPLISLMTIIFEFGSTYFLARIGNLE